MMRFKFGGFRRSQQEQEGQTGPGEQGREPSEPSSGSFAWPESTPSTTSGQPESTPSDGDSTSAPESISSAHAEGLSSAYARADQGEARSDQGDEQAHADEDQDTGEFEQVDGPEAEERQEQGSRVSVIDEDQPRPDPPPGADDEEYKWHTYRQYPSGRPDAVEFIDTYKSFGRNHILRGLNMSLPEGMVSMILGPSGTGKSVCINHMVGLLYPDEGDVTVHGESVPNMPDDDLFEMRKKFGLLFQDGALFGSMNIFDNVAFPLRQHTEKGEDEISDIVSRRLNEVGLGAHGDKMPNELSGGMRKRAGFARALVLEPDIVLFDEPDSGLDPVRTALLGELILEIHRDMMDEAKERQKEHLPTFSVVTHDIMSARRVADYINVLWKGRIVEAGPAEDMLNSDNPFIRQFLAGESQGPLTMD
ncbi:MAG TPA: ATP-binding cassette domain-containing protein [Solirubrobacteraceae bacterium]|nr:ATP-binding cassette domain-containing protein [Solirubrobacteraceae bacterium]